MSPHSAIKHPTSSREQPFQSPPPPMEAVLQAFIAAAASFLFVSSLFAFLLLCRRRPTTPLLPLSLTTTSPQPRAAPPLDEEEETASFDPSLHPISLSVLSAATHNFSPHTIVGDGSFGFVHRALLPSGTTVAVKRLSPDSSAFRGRREFRAEMDTLGRVRHPNLVPLLGYCIAGPDRLLIYDFITNGSLDTWLHDTTSTTPALPWPVRLRVARGAAAGLAFLHRECRPRIIHRDIKAGNVLLDAGFNARIADFGLARRVESSRSHVSTQVAGTMGYMPPEYREGATAATMRGDVYSFGVLLVELATGRRPSWPVRREDGREETLVAWARRAVEEGRAAEVVDTVAMGEEGMVAEEVAGFLVVACRCTEEVGKKRPDIGEVVAMLDAL